MDESSKNGRKKAPLLSNVFNYNTSMMKEHFHPPRNLEDVNRILENYDSEQKEKGKFTQLHSGKENVGTSPNSCRAPDLAPNTPRVILSDMNNSKRLARDESPSPTLFSRIWDHDLGMMSDKSAKKKSRRLPPRYESKTRSPFNASLLQTPLQTPVCQTERSTFTTSRSPLTPLSVNTNILNHDSLIPQKKHPSSASAKKHSVCVANGDKLKERIIKQSRQQHFSFPETQEDIVELMSDDSDAYSDPDYREEFLDSDPPTAASGNDKFSMRLRNKGAEHRHMPFCALDFSEKMPDNSTTDYDDNIEYSMIAGLESEFSDTDSESGIYNQTSHNML
uniref:Uncharacterized protein n=1 Tax=Daucus carota subsp. sativus TaxID=79200 RepID=A0A161ZL19_DAUCS